MRHLPLFLSCQAANTHVVERTQEMPDSARSLSSSACSILSFFKPKKLTIADVCQKLLETPNTDTRTVNNLLHAFFELFSIDNDTNEVNEDAKIVFWLMCCFYSGSRINILPKMAEHCLSFIVSSEEEWNPLHAACYRGYTALVELLLDIGVDVNCSKNGITPLHIAVQFSLTNIVEILLRHNANPNIADRTFGYTPMFLLFSDRFSHPEFEIGDTWRPCCSVVGQNKVDILKNLRHHGAEYLIYDKAGISLSEHSVSCIMSMQQECFLAACYFMRNMFFDKQGTYCGLPLVDAILRKTPSQNPQSCIFWRDNFVPFLEDLLNHGVFPNSQYSSREIFSFAIASRRSSFKSVAGLMISNAQVSDCFGHEFLSFPNLDVSPLQAACYKGDKKLLEKLLLVPLNECCCHSTTHDHHTPTALQISVTLCNPSLVSRLLKAGANKDSLRFGQNGPNLLQLACSYMGDEKGLALLLEGHRSSFCLCKHCIGDSNSKDGDINAYRKTWMFPLLKDRYSRISDSDRYNTVKILLQHGLDPTSFAFGASPMEMAFRDEQYPAVHALLDFNPMLANSSFRTRTPLTYAIDSWAPWSTRYNIVYELLKAGADTNHWKDHLIHSAIQVLVKHLNTKGGDTNTTSEQRAFFDFVLMKWKKYLLFPLLDFDVDCERKNSKGTYAEDSAVLENLKWNQPEKDRVMKVIRDSIQDLRETKRRRRLMNFCILKSLYMKKKRADLKCENSGLWSCTIELNTLTLPKRPFLQVLHYLEGNPTIPIVPHYNLDSDKPRNSQENSGFPL